MGFFDWLFGKKKKKGSTAKATPVPAAPAAGDSEEEDDEDFAEATTFVSRRLSPVTQVAIKVLRGLLGEGVAYYAWELPADACGNCRKFANAGPYRVGDGLSGKAPVPGCESPNCGCNCTVVAAAADE